MATIRDLIRLSSVTLGVTNPSPQDYDDALSLAIGMLDSWNADRLCVGSVTRSTYTWTASQSSRTIGAAGDLVGQRPEWLEYASVIPVGLTVEVPLWPLLTESEYAGIPDKTQTSDYFTRLRYQTTIPYGTLTVWPVPTTAPTLVLHVPTALTSAVTLNDTLAYAPGYREAIQYELARRLAPIFRQPWTAALEKLANTAMGRIKRANVTSEPMQCDPAITGPAGHWSIETGGYVR